MSGLVERLVEKWERQRVHGKVRRSEDDEDTARWWLNAIADELETDAEAAFKVAFTGETFPFEIRHMAQWLRLRSATEGDENG